MKSTAIVTRNRRLEVEELILPPLEEHQVYVKVQVAAFNPTDRLAYDLWAFGDGAVLGCDFAGQVFRTHPSATRYKIGDTIAGFVWGGKVKGLGSYSSYTIADERLSFKIPSSITLSESSSVPLAATTAWLALFSNDCLGFSRESSATKRSVLIWGGSSGVGYYTIQLAKLHGIEVATTCSPHNFAKVEQTGADHIFDYNDPEVISKIQASLPNVQHVFDTIGDEKSSTISAQAITKPSGALCTVRPGKTNTEGVPPHIKVTDVFVFTAFPTEHTYRGKAHWPLNIPNHELSVELHSQLESLLQDGLLRPLPIKSAGKLSPNGIEEAMLLNRQGKVSGQKLVFEGFPDDTESAPR
ncbi:hypothetical protein NM208_g8812 [Fusarium decemcellulare]|uniref:Uncharacterized protein n=1 Tax=Fusarium decemcellulare TaxID=57161 RepID=A0ACC1S3Y2_9HYPO|nr:hypothetical protein NM208_g8812 [Fusarium decemcellulare]